MEEDERAMYSGLLDYHHTLVTVRFTVLGLHLTATAFLATIALSPGARIAAVALAAVFGLVFSVFGLLMDLRTTQLLSNIGARGTRLEGMENQSGFFTLMAAQDEAGEQMPKWPFTETPLSFKISHKKYLAATYLLTMAFWIVAAVIGMIR